MVNLLFTGIRKLQVEVLVEVKVIPDPKKICLKKYRNQLHSKTIMQIY